MSLTGVSCQLAFELENSHVCEKRSNYFCPYFLLRIACEQAFGRAGNWGEGKALPFPRYFFLKQGACSQAICELRVLKATSLFIFGVRIIFQLDQNVIFQK